MDDLIEGFVRLMNMPADFSGPVNLGNSGELSIPEKNLLDRAAVELMFKRHYQDIAGIVSNSNGLKAINNPLETFAFFLSRISHKLKLNSIMPRPFANKSFEFDLASVQRVGRESFFPVFEKTSEPIFLIGQGLNPILRAFLENQMGVTSMHISNLQLYNQS